MVISPQNKIKKTNLISIIITFLISPTISIIGMMTFGGDLANPFDNDNFIYYPELFKGKMDWMFYFSSFYIFLNII